MAEVAPEQLVELPLADGRRVYMRTDECAPDNVVWLTRDELVMLWRRCWIDWQADIAAGDESRWRRDRKFAHAEAGFAAGRTSPVPLAQLALNERRLCVSFTDGITRTIWLLANGVTRFPVALHDGDRAAYDRVVHAVRQMPESERFVVDRTPFVPTVGVEAPVRARSRWVVPAVLMLSLLVALYFLSLTARS